MMLRKTPLRSKPRPEPKRERAAPVRSSIGPSSPVRMAVDLSGAATKPQELTIRREHTGTAAEKRYMGRVAALGCVVCRLLGFGSTPAQVHHCREEQGGGQRGGNFCTIPLCEPHHTGPTGLHGDKSALRQLKMTEMDLLDITIGDLHG